MFSFLNKLCEKYAQIAVSDLSVKDNSNPFLSELSKKKSFDDRVEFVEEKYEKLGTGSSRTIFKLNDDLILKVAHNEKGIAQNKVEMNPKLQRACTNNIVMADGEGKWVIAPFTENIKKEDFKKYVGYSIDPFMNALFYKFNQESDNWNAPRDYEEIEELPLFKCLEQLVLDGDILLGDASKESSWGISKNGKILLRDIGLSREVYDDYYKSNSHSSSEPKSSE